VDIAMKSHQQPCKGWIIIAGHNGKQMPTTRYGLDYSSCGHCDENTPTTL
jgi:hypothetical protein